MKLNFLCLLVLVAISRQGFVDHVKGMPKKYCPMRGLNGQSYCPAMRKSRLQTPYEKYLDTLPRTDPLITGIQIDTASKSSEFKIHVTQAAISQEGSLSEFVDEVVETYESEKLPDMTYDQKAVPKITSGFGYDRVTREMKFPVYSTQLLSPSVAVQDDARVFTSANHFIDYSVNRHSTQQAGLYVRDLNSIRQIANTFRDSSTKMGIVQKKYRTHVSKTAGTPLPEFLGAVNSLPPFNAGNRGVIDQYRNIIQWWGTDYAVNVQHGGIIYQQTTIKECHGGNLAPHMVNDINAVIGRTPPPGSGYLQYRRLGVFEVRGGNPTFGQNRINDRINSFAAAAAPIQWDTKPLWEAVPDATRRQWMQQAITHYISDHSNTVNKMKADISAARVAHYRSRRRLHPVIWNLEHWGPIVTRWNGCAAVQYNGGVYAPHCTLRREDVLIGAGQRMSIGSGFSGTDTIIERNANGQVRILMMHGTNTVETSGWVSRGCATVKQIGRACGRRYCMNVDQVLRRSICIDVTPAIRTAGGRHNQVNSYLNPVCPSF